ncbi:MAG TPA: SHOCT domain-containing protein [Acholeplasmataceae bacterium]|nr:SHOCT domain-containing protein [Acholeplasmataceae bacterium]
MKKIFSFIKEKECAPILSIAAKVFKVFYLSLAVISSLVTIISGIISIEYELGYFFLSLLISAGLFFVIYFIGLLTETIILSFSVITKNHFEELKIKGFHKENGQNDFDILNKLNLLKSSYNQGLLTEEEYLEKRNDLLNNID